MDLGRVIFPYGMKRNFNGEWIVFNKHENPLGFNGFGTMDTYSLPVRFWLRGLGEATLLKLAHSPDAILRDRKGEICRVYFYLLDKDRFTPEYNEKLTILNRLHIIQ